MSKKRYITKHAVLPNGLRVVCVETPHLSSAYVGVVIAAGSRHESPRDNGLSHFLEHMVFRGTARYGDAKDINAAAESIGGQVDAATYRDHTHYGTLTHPTKIDTALELLSEILLAPKFHHLETERTIIREEMRESYGTRGQMVEVDTLTHALSYPDHPLGQPIEGTQANVGRFTRGDLARHLRRHYTAQSSVLVIAGRVEHKRALALAKKHFGKMPSGKPVRTTPPALRTKPVLHWVSDPGSQVDLRLSFAAVSANEADAAALNVLSRVLGEGLSSRLHAELIDEKGLAYSLSAGPEMFADCGTYDFDVAVAPQKLVRTSKELWAFAQNAVRHPPTSKELALAKERYEIALDFMADAPADLALWASRNLLLGIDADVDRAAERFFAVTTDDCARVARRVFDARGLVVCGVGQIATRDRATLRRLFTA